MMRKTIKSVRMYICMAILVCSFAGISSCNPGTDEVKAPALPTGLNVPDIQDIYAVLAWDGEATIYEVSVDGGEAKAVTSKSYKATGLTPEKDYTWKVRAKVDGLYSEWVDGPAFTTKPLIIVPVEPDRPINLTVEDVKATTAAFSWQGTAEFFEIEVGGVSEIVDATTFTASGLTPEMTYDWRVRAKDGDLYSDWVTGAVFTTTYQIPESIEFTHNFLSAYDDDYYGANTSNFSLMLTTVDIDPAIDNTGWMIALDILATQVDETHESGYLNIPEGTYNFSTTVATGNVILGTGSQTATMLARVFANANYTATAPITGGTVNIEGDHSNYSITMDMILADGTAVAGSYNGPILIAIPEPIAPFIGKIAAAELDVFGGNPNKNYNLRLSDEAKAGTGDGFMLTIDIWGVGDDKKVIPDGTYTWGGKNAWQIDPAWSYYRRYEKNVMAASETITDMTLTTKNTGTNTYDIEVHVVTSNGTEVTRTYSGEVVIMYGA